VTQIHEVDMAVMNPTSGDSEGKTKSRIATTSEDRLLVAVRISPVCFTWSNLTDVITQKQQLQNSNSAQTKIHVMFEEMMQELRETKKALETTEDELDSTKSELESTKSDLSVTRKSLAKAKLTAKCYHDKLSSAKRKFHGSESAPKTKEEKNGYLEIKLAIEKKKARKNENAQKKPEQLQSQWSSRFHILSNENTEG
jgi:chromosome segregation ATPase